MLGLRRRRWANNKTSLFQRLQSTWDHLTGLRLETNVRAKQQRQSSEIQQDAQRLNNRMHKDLNEL